MSVQQSFETTQMVTSFFARLDRLDRVVRIMVSDAPLRARFTVRGDVKRSVVLDLSGKTARRVVDDEREASDIEVAMTASDWHQVLTGELAPGLACGRRQMLLKGCASHLACFIPLFDFAPMLYREHQRLVALEGPPEGVGQAQFGRTSPANDEETSMFEKGIRAQARRLVRGDAVRQRAYGAMDDVAYALGYGLEKARGRFRRMNLFSLLEAMSRGIAAAELDASKTDGES